MTTSLAHGLRAELAPLNDAPIRVLRDELLFRRGQTKAHLYEIAAGTIAVTVPDALILEVCRMFYCAAN